MDSKKHLPLIGVGPIIVIPQIIITFLGIYLSNTKKISIIKIDFLKVPFMILGILLIMLGLKMWIAANFFTKIDNSIKENKLETSGIYSYVRNPIYSAFFIACIGALLIENNIILFIIPIICWIYMTILLINTEEKWLYKLYGDDYKEYSKKVNRCIPFKRKIKMEKDFIELSKKWFNKQAPVYDETNTILYSKYGKISCENIYNYLKDKDYKSLLDIGCGTGYLINMLAKDHNAEYTGLDLSPEMIKQANKKNIKNAKFIEGRSDEIPFYDNTFDIITCSQSFHHYPDTDKAMQEAKRVLKKDGIYILSDTGCRSI